MNAMQNAAVAWGYRMVPPPTVWALDALLSLCVLIVMWAYWRSWRGLWTGWHTLRMLGYLLLLAGVGLGAINLYANQESVPAYRLLILVAVAVLLLGDGQRAGKHRNHRREEEGRPRRWWGW